ncbi:MAG TPA: sigma-70 family RNA polymerase sigma factor [Chloroflexota bacterium]|nr:sigma-70 family RNA polymerase sigma factor [Chloroflexota bacterium]
MTTDDQKTRRRGVSFGTTSSRSADAVKAPAGEPADEALLEAARLHDTAALATLYDRHHRVAMAVAFRLLRNQQLAEDVVQDAFLAVWRQGSTYQMGRGSVRNWLLSIVHHRAVDRLRRRDMAQPAAPLDDPQLEAGGPEVWEEASQNMERERVREALQSLPDEQRKTVELACFAGFSCQAIAERMSLPLGTVKGRMRLALQKLRRQLADVQVVSVDGPAGNLMDGKDLVS